MRQIGDLDLLLGSSHYPSKFAQPRPRFTVLKRRPLKNPLAARWKVQLMQGQSVKAALHNAFKSWAFCILLTCPFLSRLLDDLSVFYGLFEWEKKALQYTSHCLGTLAWVKKMFWYGDYYRSQIYAFPDWNLSKLKFFN